MRERAEIEAKNKMEQDALHDKFAATRAEQERLFKVKSIKEMDDHMRARQVVQDIEAQTKGLQLEEMSRANRAIMNADQLESQIE